MYKCSIWKLFKKIQLSLVKTVHTYSKHLGVFYYGPLRILDSLLPTDPCNAWEMSTDTCTPSRGRITFCISSIHVRRALLFNCMETCAYIMQKTLKLTLLLSQQKLKKNIWHILGFLNTNSDLGCQGQAPLWPIHLSKPPCYIISFMN